LADNVKLLMLELALVMDEGFALLEGCVQRILAFADPRLVAMVALETWLPVLCAASVVDYM
jgi:hypothetical protein